MIRSVSAALLAGLISTACSHKVELYCDESTPCTDPERPFCDINGQYEASEFIGNTCIPDPFGNADAGVNVDADPLAPDADPNAPDADPNAPDADPGEVADGGADPIVADVAHVPSAAEFAGTANIVIDADITINTTTLTYDGASAPAGTTFDASPHSGIGPELAIWHVRSLTVKAGRAVRIVGTRPMVIIASGQVTINGLLDAGARRQNAGAGGTNQATGGTGEHKGSLRDGGGGGGGHATSGGSGGDATCSVNCGDGQGTASGGMAGGTYGDAAVSVLYGGSVGGFSSPNCASDPAGAGGGALQIYSGTSIVISASGAIQAGGGGGGGGRACVGNPGSASGGGSGGTVFLQARDIVHAGIIAANGGGGGSGASDETGTDLPGNAGENGRLGSTAAVGGASVGTHSGAGGAGGVDTAGGNGGSDFTNDGNGGGGGGGAGRVAFVHATSGTIDQSSGETSPPAAVGTF